jgi:hypothetical protein
MRSKKTNFRTGQPFTPSRSLPTAVAQRQNQSAAAAVAIGIDLDQYCGPELSHWPGNNQMNPSALGALPTCRKCAARPGDFAQNTLAHTGERTKKYRRSHVWPRELMHDGNSREQVE